MFEGASAVAWVEGRDGPAPRLRPAIPVTTTLQETDCFVGAHHCGRALDKPPSSGGALQTCHMSVLECIVLFGPDTTGPGTTPTPSPDCDRSLTTHHMTPHLNGGTTLRIVSPRQPQGCAMHAPQYCLPARLCAPHSLWPLWWNDGTAGAPTPYQITACSHASRVHLHTGVSPSTPSNVNEPIQPPLTLHNQRSTRDAFMSGSRSAEQRWQLPGR